MDITKQIGQGEQDQIQVGNQEDGKTKQYEKGQIADINGTNGRK